MFVSKSKYDMQCRVSDALAGQVIKYRDEYTKLVRDWNALVNRFNTDKHNGSARANDMTARLLKLRDKP